MSQKKIFAVIPARGSSKRVPRKNIRDLCGYPLIYYTIKAASMSTLIDMCIISSDDDEIIEISKYYGAEVLFKRPDFLSTDTTKTVDVLIHAVEYVENNDIFHPDIVVILEPTSPLRSAQDIDSALRIHLDSDADSVVSIVQTDHWHPVRAKKIIGDRLADYCLKEDEGVRRQDLPPAYFRNGAFYSVRRDLLMNQHCLFGEKVGYYIMPEASFVDVNSETDLLYAEILMKRSTITN